MNIQQLTESLLLRLGSGDAGAIAALFADRVDWLVPGNPALPWIGPRSHRHEVAAFFRTMWPRFVPGESRATVDAILFSGEDAVVLATFAHTAAATNRAFRTPVAIRLTAANGELVRLHLYEDSWTVSEALLSPTIEATAAAGP